MAAFLSDGRFTNQTTARVLSTYTNATFIDGGVTTGINFTPNPDCTIPGGIGSFDQTIFVINYGSTGQPQALSTRQVHIDLTPPPAPISDGPDGIKVAGGNEAVTISWTRIDSSITTDLLGYQVLCNRAGELQVFNDGTFSAGFQECGMPGGDAGVAASVNDGGVNGLDPRFICSPLLSPTTSSFRVKILQNGITYGVGVVAIDISGNASKPDIFYPTAVKTDSFYDVYRNEADAEHAGAASGGLCTLGAPTSSHGAIVGLGAALVLGAVFFVRRRRRK
jgi:LPXTG-motif cell wall-anchored protein